MITHIHGKLVEKTPTYVVVDVNGVGYKIKISLQTFSVINEEFCNVDLDSGGSVKALKINVNSIGDKTKLSVRPERVTIGTKDSNHNQFEGQVEELIYLGDHIRARLNTCGSKDFIVKIPNEGDLNIKESSKIKISWDPSDIRALDYSQ